MTYIYQIFGNYFNELDRVIHLSQEYRDRLDSIPGILSNGLFYQQEEDGLTVSTLYRCKERVTAEKVQSVIHEIMKKHDSDIGFTTEFIFKEIDYEHASSCKRAFTSK